MTRFHWARHKNKIIKCLHCNLLYLYTEVVGIIDVETILKKEEDKKIIMHYALLINTVDNSKLYSFYTVEHG